MRDREKNDFIFIFCNFKLRVKFSQQFKKLHICFILNEVESAFVFHVQRRCLSVSNFLNLFKDGEEFSSRAK